MQNSIIDRMLITGDLQKNVGVRPHKERVKRKTSKKKFANKCREVNLLLVKMRTCRLQEIIAKLNQILTGYYHYYGITDNIESIGWGLNPEKTYSFKGEYLEEQKMVVFSLKNTD